MNESEYPPEFGDRFGADAGMDYYPQQMSPMPQIEDTASIIKQIDPSNIVRRIELKLQGYPLDAKGTPIEERKGRALMNDEGINSIMSIVDSYVNLNTSLSNIEDTEISSIIIQLTRDLCMLLMVHRKEYGIKYSTDRTRIMQIIVPPIYFVLKRSLKEGDKRFLKGQTIEHISRQYSGNKQMGMMSMLNPFRSKSKDDGGRY